MLPTCRFGRHRDWMLFVTVSAVIALCGSTRHDVGTLTLLGLALQMRFRLLVPCMLAASTVLPVISAAHFAHGVLLPLACCYCLEARMRHLYMQAVNL